MKRVALGLMLVLAVTGAAPAPAESPCPNVRTGDEKRSAKLATSLSLITRLLSSIGLTGEYTSEVKSRLPDRTDQILALYQYKVVCEIIYADRTLSTADRLKYLRQEFQSIFLITRISPQSRLQPRPTIDTTGVSSVRLRPEPKNTLYSLVAGFQLADAASAPVVKELPPPPTSPPPQGATIIRVFPKKNLDVVGVIKLRRLLLNYDVRIGSSQISPSHLADTLFVDRDKVSREQVIEVLRTLNEHGVRIKSVQQSTFKQAEIQIGTVLRPDGKQVFGSAQPLDIDELANAMGVDFWRAAFNGYVSCSGGVGRAYACTMSPDARPEPRPERPGRPNPSAR